MVAIPSACVIEPADSMLQGIYPPDKQEKNIPIHPSMPTSTSECSNRQQRQAVPHPLATVSVAKDARRATGGKKREENNNNHHLSSSLFFLLLAFASFPGYNPIPSDRLQINTVFLIPVLIRDIEQKSRNGWVDGDLRHRKTSKPPSLSARGFNLNNSRPCP